MQTRTNSKPKSKTKKVVCDICETEVTDTSRGRNRHMTEKHTKGMEFTALTKAIEGTNGTARTALAPHILDIMSKEPHKIFRSRDFLGLIDIEGLTTQNISNAVNWMARSEKFPMIHSENRGEYYFFEAAEPTLKPFNLSENIEALGEIVAQTSDAFISEVKIEGEMIGYTLDNMPIVLRDGHAFAVDIVYTALGS